MDKILVETSARHVHVTREALDYLFGPDYQLTAKKMLSQPGQYASTTLEHLESKHLLEKVAMLKEVLQSQLKTQKMVKKFN